MEVLMFILPVLICLNIPGSKGETLQNVLERLDILEEGYLDLKVDFVSSEHKMTKRIFRAKNSLRNEILNTIKKQINDALSDTLRSESIDAMIKSQVISETRHLKLANHQMRRELDLMKKKLGRVQQDNTRYREAVQKGTVSTQWPVATTLNSSLSTTEAAPAATTTAASTTTTSTTTASSSTSTTSSSTSTTTSITSTIKTSTSTTAASTTTHTPRKERNRILVIPLNEETAHQFKQINIQDKAVSNYVFLKLKHIVCVVYVSRINSLLIAQAEPKRILSSRLDTSTTEILRDGVGASSIAVDEGRGLVFLGAKGKGKQIYRMDLNGKHLTALLNITSTLRAIVVNPDIRTIYVSASDKLLSLSYDGNNVVTLDTGSFMTAVTLDISKGYVYYTKSDSGLYRYAISQNTTSKEVTLSFDPYNLRYYNGSIYYIDWFSGVEIFSLVDRSITLVHELENLNILGYSFCLIP